MSKVALTAHSYNHLFPALFSTSAISYDSYQSKFKQVNMDFTRVEVLHEVAACIYTINEQVDAWLGLRLRS